MKKVGCIACVVALLLGLGCSSHYIGMQLLPSAYKIFIQPEGGHHSINYDRISIDYDYKINLENMELTFEGQYECKDLLKNIADSYWKDMTLTLEVLFLDGYYKVIDVRHITFFMVGDSEEAIGKFIKKFKYHPSFTYVHWRWKFSGYYMQ